MHSFRGKVDFSHLSNTGNFVALSHLLRPPPSWPRPTIVSQSPSKHLHANRSLSHANRVSGRAFPARRVKTSAEIAQILGLTKRTVDFHIDSARIKLGATTRTQAAIKATAGRLIEP